jgi:ActR/RegA family two-component response regulator
VAVGVHPHVPRVVRLLSGAAFTSTSLVRGSTLRNQGVEVADVVLVDDDRCFGRALARDLELRGLTVLWLRSFGAAAAGLSASSDTFRYALVDDLLGDGYGVDLLPLLDARSPPPATALFTADVSTARALQVLRAGRTLLPKPATRDEIGTLLQTLDQLGRQVAPRFAPQLTLDSHGLGTPTGYVLLPRTALLLVRYLATRAERFTPASEVAANLLNRRDAAGAVLIRRHVADARRVLGPYSWLIASDPKRGYRIAQHMRLQDERSAG